MPNSNYLQNLLSILQINTKIFCCFKLIVHCSINMYQNKTSNLLQRYYKNESYANNVKLVFSYYTISRANNFVVSFDLNFLLNKMIMGNQS